MTFPLILGKGKRLFGRGAVPAGLKLVASTTSSSGVIISRYARSGEITPGSFALAEPTPRGAGAAGADETGGIERLPS